MGLIVRCLVVLLWLTVPLLAGCRHSSAPDNAPRKHEEGEKPALQAPADPTEEAEAAPSQTQVEPPPPLKIPEVVLSDELRATCLVNVGDLLPEGELSNLDGSAVKTTAWYGPKLSVVCFWTIGTTPRSRLVAEALLRDLMKGVAEPFGERGVRIVAINVGDGAEEAKRYAEEANVSFPVLLDPRGEFFARVAKEGKTPRTFLLDSRGKVLWFDLEYSNTARRDLTLGIEAALKEIE